MTYLFTDTEIGRFYDNVERMDGLDQKYEYERLSAIERYRRKYQWQSAATGPPEPVDRPKTIHNRQFREASDAD